ncbi:MAG: hypothetical protein AMS19_09525 [Gemmatimonas sp. SG8_23]|jgi:hypothetical protein|nr:MAG: hypothetical protein AMS19_09525 [Gemmatimonas sp. SG8_23]
MIHSRIRVRGRLGPDWSDRLHGLRIASLSGAEHDETTLEGPLPDQAALQGVITTLGDLNLALVSVEVLETDASPSIPSTHDSH